jgi:hypothetical protein
MRLLGREVSSSPMMLRVVPPGAGPAYLAAVRPWKTVGAGCMAALRQGPRPDAGTGDIGTGDTQLPIKRRWQKYVAYVGFWQGSMKLDRVRTIPAQRRHAV